MLPDLAAIPPRTDDECVRYGVPGYGVPGTTVRREEDVPWVRMMGEMEIGDSFHVPPRRTSAVRAMARLASESMDRCYIVNPVPGGWRCWRTR